MKVVILAGGKGTRIGEETQFRPKPMIEIGHHPILWHIMKHYSEYGFEDFIVCCGYKGHMIKEYFLNYYSNYSNTKFDLQTQEIKYLNAPMESWRVTMVNTGLNTLTAGRIKQVKDYVGNEPFMLTYGDGVSDIDLDALLAFHKKNKKLLTVSVAKPEGRFGVAKVDDESGLIQGFKEKSRDDQHYVNIGFMVCEPEIFDYLGDGSEMLEAGPFHDIVADGQMIAYKHSGFWSPMDNMKDREYLEELICEKRAPWIREFAD